MTGNHQDNTPEPARLLTASEVAALFRVSVKTPARWVLEGKVSSTRTPGGHHRFREDEMLALLNGGRP